MTEPPGEEHQLPGDDVATNVETGKGRGARARSAFQARREQLTTKAGDVRSRMEDARPRSAAIDSVMRTVEHDSTTGGTVLAGAVAFRLFLVLVPFVFVIVMALGFSVSEDASAQDLASNIGIGGLVAAAVEGTNELSVWQRLVTVVVGLVALLWATRTALKVLRITHSLIWGTRATRQPTAKPVLVFLGVMLLFALGGLLIRKIEDVNLLLGLLAMGASVVLPAALWLLASIHFPHADAPWWALLPGAVIFGVGVEVLHFITVYWIAREIESKSDTYGAIGAALALLFWAYLLGRIITFGAVVNAALWRRHQFMASHGGDGQPEG